MADVEDKYGSIEALTGGGNEVGESTTRRRRKPTAISALENKSSTGSMLDKLNQEKMQLQEEVQALKQKGEKADELEKEISHLRSTFEEEMGRLVAEQKSGGEATPIKLTMPITQQQVAFELMTIDPSLIDVSEENERIQKYLDAISLNDILPSIRKHGQQKPGMLRARADGRYELIEGSRRLAAVTMLAKEPYLALVGDVPDADVRELSLIENRHRDVSPYEKAKSYARRIAQGEYKNWEQLGAAHGISDSHINRYKKAAELDDVFITILPSPSDMTLAYAEDISKLLAKDDNKGKLVKEAKNLYELRQRALKEGTDSLDYDSVFRVLKSAIRKKIQNPTKKRPVKYASKDGQTTLKHAVTNSGHVKFEIGGASEEDINRILEQLKKTLKMV